MTPEQFAALLAANPAKVLGEIEPVVKKAAVNVKKSWRDAAKASSGQHASGYPFTIEFDAVKRSGQSVEVEVAPKGEGQGNLAPILEFGTVNNAPTGDGAAAAEAEGKNFAKWLSKAIGKAWR